MQPSNTYEWIKKDTRRRTILTAIRRPMTGKQIGRKTGILAGTCCHLVGKFTAAGITRCLNPAARNSRVYGLTELGIRYQNQLDQDWNLPPKEYINPSVNWDLYGWLCFSHRGIVIKTLIEPMQPAQIKRILRVQKPNLKISANNIRDVMRLFVTRGIVQPVHIPKKAHRRFELTTLGIQLRELLIQAENPL